MTAFNGERRRYNNVGAKDKPKLFRENRIYIYSSYDKAFIIIIIIIRYHYISLQLSVTHANIHVNFGA